MAERYSEADVQLVAGLLPGIIAIEHGCLPDECDLTSDTEADGWRNIAKNIVAGLAAAGRLLPGGASPAECGCPIKVEAATVTRHTRECSNNKAAARLAAHIADEYGPEPCPSVNCADECDGTCMARVRNENRDQGSTDE